MGVFSTKSFCFCLSLRTGGLALGCLYALMGILFTSRAAVQQIHNRKYYGEMIDLPDFAAEVGTNHKITIFYFNFYQILYWFCINKQVY